MSGDAISGPAAKLAQDGSYSYTYSTRAGAIALYHGDVLVDAVIYGSKQSNSSANGTIARPDYESGRNRCPILLAGTSARRQ